MRKQHPGTIFYKFMLLVTIISLGLFGGSVPPTSAWIANLPLTNLLPQPAPVSAAPDSEWTQEAHDAQRTGFTLQDVPQPWTLAWTWNGPDANGGTGGHSYNAPADAHTVTGGNFVFVPAGQSGLFALNKSNGAQAWRVTSAAFNAAPAYDPATGSLLAGGADGKLYKINGSSGQVQGTYTAGSPINKAVLLVDDSAYITTANGDLHKVNISNLSGAWKYSAGSTVATPAAYSAGADVLVFATEDLYVHAVRASDGGQQWRVKPTSRPAQAPYTFSGFWPVIAEQHGIVFIRLNLGSNALWSGNQTGTAGGGVYPSSNDATRQLLQANNGALENLFALDLNDGSKRFIPAVGYGGTEYRTGSGSEGLFLVAPPVPVVKVNSDGSEVAYISFRSGQGDILDGRWDSHMGEMVLDDSTISGLAAGDLRFVDFPNGYVNITDEQTPFTMSGDTIFHAHWGASDGVRITDRSSGKGLTAGNPISAQAIPAVIRRQQSCGDFNPTTHQTSCGLTLYGDGRYWSGPGFWTYWNTYDPPTTASGAYSDGLKPRYTYASNGLVIVEGNGGELVVLRSANSAPAPTPTRSNATPTRTPTRTPTQAPGGSTATPSGSGSWVYCANENGTCSFTGTHQVRYGANNSYVTKTLTGGTACTNAVFGDPAPGYVKTCSYEQIGAPTTAPTADPTATRAPTNAPTATRAPTLAPTATRLPTNAPTATRLPTNVPTATRAATNVPTATPAQSGTWVFCANEGGTCSFNGTYQVRYGAKNTYAYKTATNSITCSNAVFGDPIAGVVKTCAYFLPGSTATPTRAATTAPTATRTPTRAATTAPTATRTPTRAPTQPPTTAPTATRTPTQAATLAPTSIPAQTGTWVFCANEGGTCSFSGTYQVRYGAKDTYAYKNATSTIACTNAVFGDPIAGVVKTCSYFLPGSTATPTRAATTAPTQAPTTAPTATRTPTRAPTQAPTTAPTATRTPTRAATAVNTATPSQSGSWVFCSNENGTCSFSGTFQVRYGANNSYAYKTATNSIACTNAVFGDPIPGVTKTCSYLNTSATTVPTQPGATNTPAPAGTATPTQPAGPTSTVAPGSGRITNLKVIAGSPAVFEKFEVQFSMQTSATNLDLPYDANPPAGVQPGTGITVNALFSVDNWKTTITQPAFLYQPYNATVSENHDHMTPSGGPVWAVRFAPQQAGAWQYRISMQDSQGQVIYPATNQPALTFTVGASSSNPYTRKGFVGVSPADRRYFQFGDGSPFLGVGFNDAFTGSSSASVEQKMIAYEQNKMNFMRVWMSGAGINGSQWPAWASNFLPNDDYLPGVSFDTTNTYNGNLVSVRLDNTGPCLYADFWRGGVPVEPNTTYTVTARVKTSGVTGSGDYGFVIKQGGWLDKSCVNSGTGTRITAPVNGTKDWTVVTGTYTTSSSQKWMDNLYLVRENATGGQVYIDEVHMYRSNDANKVDILRQPYANSTEHFDTMTAAQWDLYIQSAEKHGVYLKMVIDEKNEWIRNHMGADGKLTSPGNNNNFYAAPGTKSRWLQQAWWRYLIARWGYSTAIHSFEYINEGDPYNGNHYAAAGAMATYFKQNDPSHHMVSTSFWHSFPNKEFWSNPQYADIAYSDIHAYISTGWNTDASFIPAAMKESTITNVHSGKGSAKLSGSSAISQTFVPRGTVIQGQGEWVIKYWMKASGLTATCGYGSTGSSMRIRWMLDGGNYGGGKEGVVPYNSEVKDYICTSPSGTFDWRQFSSLADRNGSTLPTTARIIVADNNPHELNLLLENSGGTGGTAWIDDVQLISPSGQVQPVIGTFETIPLKEDTAWSTMAYGQVFGGGSLIGAPKPMVRGETGLDDGTTYDPDQVRDTQGIWLHNNVWAQMNAGGMLDLFWWASETIPQSIYYNYQTYQNFMAGIPLSNGHYRDSGATASHPDLRVVGQRDDTAGRMHLWIQNTQHSWRRAVNGPAISAVSGTITIPNVTSGTYRVEWWNTYNTSNPVIKTETVTANGALTLTLPSALADDIAVKITRN